jgi:crotonobetainyl-CoA:carnitine CoA-transferase CaiB-like acyl-CoA transferase
MLDHRPLAGVRIIELARIIALPATGILLSAMGAEVIRVQNKNLPDFTVRSYQSSMKQGC